MKKVKLILSAFAALAFVTVFASGGGEGSTCTTDVNGKCHCKTLYDGPKVIGYQCVTDGGNPDILCACPKND